MIGVVLLRWVVGDFGGRDLLETWSPWSPTSPKPSHNNNRKQESGAGR